jgi:hypothetical protein
MAEDGRMPWGMKLGALRRWDAEELEAWIAAGCKPVCQTGREAVKDHASLDDCDDLSSTDH